MTDREGFDYYEQLAVRQNEILQTLIDISRVITNSHGLDETLAHTVDLIAGRMGVDVCSIYLYDKTTGDLELKATHGLNLASVGHVRMPVQEGLVGLIVEQNQTINVVDVAKHERFKFVPGLQEERLQSFMGVPLIEYRRTLGVLAVQNEQSRLFTREEENLLLTIASQISGLISKALVVDRVQREAPPQPAPQKSTEQEQFQGIPIAPGLIYDNVVLLKRREIDEPEYTPQHPPGEENECLKRAIEASVQEILDLIREVTERATEQEAAIFHAHLLFLEDRSFIQRMTDLIEGGSSAAWAVSRVVRDALRTFRAIDDPYLLERAVDVEDVGLRLLHHLGAAHRGGAHMGREGILVAQLLTPSDTAQLDPHKVRGIITEMGGHVSHAAILARSLRIPAVSGVANATELLTEGEPVLVNGDEGTVVVNPDAALLSHYETHQENRAVYLSHLDELRDTLCTTACGQRIALHANISLSQDLEDFDRFGAEGIGLLRTEIQYLMRATRPSVSDLTDYYERVLQVAGDTPVKFRTLDLGGDKFPSYLDFPKEENPFLGCRSIRYQLRRPWLLKEQLHAILRAAKHGNVQLMFPMISHVDELYQVKQIYADCRREVAEATGEEPPQLKIGMMFEVPSAVLMGELFAGEVDFFSIGSNDLTQYTLAVDRNNPNVSHLYDPLEPAVLMMIKRVIEVANKFGRPVELCGEMASDPEGCLVLVGLGLRELSMNPPLIPLVKDRLAQITLEDTESLARLALNSTSAANVRRNIRRFVHQ